MKCARFITITDLHQHVDLFRQLMDAVEIHRPDAILSGGDFLHRPYSPNSLSRADLARSLRRAKVPLIMARGNHEGHNWTPFADFLPEAVTLHAERRVVGGVPVIGFPCPIDDDSEFRGERPYHHSLLDWLPRVSAPGKAASDIWLSHIPPLGAGLADANADRYGGTRELTAAIRVFQPRLVISGHDHNTPLDSGRWHTRIGNTICVNLGQEVADDQEGGLHYGVCEISEGGMEFTHWRGSEIVGQVSDYAGASDLAHAESEAVAA